jgi:hypothetical protein
MATTSNLDNNADSNMRVNLRDIVKERSKWERPLGICNYGRKVIPSALWAGEAPTLPSSLQIMRPQVTSPSSLF